MALKTYRPTSPARRQMTSADYQIITKKAPEKTLLAKKTKTAGRNAYGRITVRHRGGGNRQKYRIVDFKRQRDGIAAKVVAIEYDPNRSAHLALLQYVDGQRHYILLPQGLNVGDTVVSGPDADIKPGNALPFTAIPVGAEVHNVELKPGAGAILVRSAGTSAQLLAKEGRFATLRMPSGEVRLVPLTCRATIGVVGNPEHEIVNHGKAGRVRHLGRRPKVRGSVMNPCDHPHGGGEGKSPVGRPGPLTPWGVPTLGYKTRKTKRSDQYIIRRRKK